ncbi:MAG: ATP-binding protein [Pseudomonadota bacterium]|nr:ATP-binding protein [Pseudomonadota bacterium]
MRVTTKLSTPPYVSYGLGVVLGGMAALLQWSVLHLMGSQDPFLFFLPALVVAVIFLGRGPAMLILVAGILDGALVVPPVGGLAIQHVDLAAVLLFAAVGTLIVVYGDRLQFTTARAALAEQRLALAQKNTGVGIFELDFEARTAFVTPSMCHMLGREVTQGEINLDRWLGGLRAEHVEESQRAIEEHIARGEFRYEREQRIERSNGEIRWVLNRVELEATPAGKCRIARGAAVDITERKRMDELLQRAQASLKQQLQDVGRLHTFSQSLVAAGDELPAALQSLLDITLELYGAHHGIVSLRNPDTDSLRVVAQAGFTTEAIDKLFAGAASRLEGSAHHAAPDNAHQKPLLDWHRALATQQNLEGLQSELLLNAAGDVMGGISVMFAEPREPSEREKRLAEVCAASAAAVVERQRARTTAAQNERRFSVALESSVVPFTILTPMRHSDGEIFDFRWTYLNPAAARALRRDVADLIGKRIGAVLPRAWQADGLFDRYVSVIEHEEQCEFEMQTAATDQGVRWYNVLAAPLEGSLAVWFTNITGRKKYEETLREADRRKDEFLATLAHELRNPLAPIRQGVRIAASANSTDAQRRWSHAIIERQVQHMSLLLEDLLDVSRIGRGTLLLRKSIERLSEVMDTAIEAARPHLEAKRHQLEKSLPPAPVFLEIDPVRIAQVLGNLLTNAAKYTDPGGRILVSAKREGAEFVIRVRDNGIGLSEQQQTEVFEMFSQVPAAVEKSQGGLGIGLALARGLIELHGGIIEASSGGLGQGTEVIVRLPGSCIVSDREVGPAQSAPPPAKTDVRPKRSVLIADDNVDAADSLAELLRLEGYEVHVAYDGAEALATFARVDPDAALLDVGMPYVSGLEVVRAIRRQPTGQRATLIAVTGWGQERDRRMALEAGFDHHLTKPMVPEVIQDLIDRGRARDPS